MIRIATKPMASDIESNKDSKPSATILTDEVDNPNMMRIVPMAKLTVKAVASAKFILLVLISSFLCDVSYIEK